MGDGRWTAGALAMCRRDLSAVLPGVAISISLVPPLGVVGVCVGQGEWAGAGGALLLFLSNVVSLVVAGSIVFTLAGYAREPGSRPGANRRRAYTIVALLSFLIVVPLAVNTAFTVLIAHWTNTIRAATEEWIAADSTATVVDVRWNGATAIVDVTSADGTVPPLPPLADELQQVLPEAISVVVNAEVAISYPVVNQ